MRVSIFAVARFSVKSAKINVPRTFPLLQYLDYNKTKIDQMAIFFLPNNGPYVWQKHGK